MTTALDVGGYFAELARNEREPEPLTLGRLQKLLFLSQGWHLAAFGEPLFPERVLSGTNGPTVEGVDDVPATYPGLTWSARRFTEATWDKYKGSTTSGLRDLITTDLATIGAGSLVGDDHGAAQVIPNDRLRQLYVDRPELQHFSPQEWLAVGEGELEFEQGKVVPLSAVLQRLQARCLTS